MYIKNFSPSSKPLLVFLHGFLGRPQDYSFLLSLGKYFRLLFIDYSGNPREKRAYYKNYIVYTCRETSFQNLAKEILNIIKRYHFRYPKIYAIGYSMGGRILLEIIKNKNSLFQKIVLESAGLGFEKEDEKDKRNNQDKEILKNWQKESFDCFLEKWYDMPLFSSLRNKPSLRENFIKKHGASDTDKIAYLQKIFCGCSPTIHPYFLPTLKKIASYSKERNRQSTKVLYLAGELDKKYCSNALLIKKNIPQAKVKIISGCGHHVKMENKDIYQKAVFSFLLNLEKH